jgi:hypothetical protein
MKKTAVPSCPEQHLTGTPSYCDLVWIGDEWWCRAAQPSQFRRHQQRALDVNVRLDQARQHTLAGKGDRLASRPVISADASDPPIGNDNIRGFNLTGEDVDDASAAQQQVAGFLAQRDADAPL